MIKKAMETKLNIKPVMGILVHSDFWEGPCRGGIKEEMLFYHYGEKRAYKEKQVTILNIYN